MTLCSLSRIVSVFFSLLCVGVPAYAQKGTFRGQLQDAVAATPLAYANVRVYKVADNELAGGALSADNGAFSVQLPFGTYRAEVEYVGFETVKTDTFSLYGSRSVYDLGILNITAATRSLGEVEIVAEKSSMVLSLDKKIFNVGKDLANAGGSATEILTNIPSVSVDPDGTVKLRGSDNVRILIDGKPSGLVSFKGSAGLQQLQASMIDRVEIITNPSARYEAEGSGGIINIVLKKDQKQGFNGSFELISGYPYNLGASANLNYRHRKVNFFINYGIAHRKSPGGGDLYQRRTSGDTTYVLLQTTENRMKSLNNNVRGGLDYFFTENSVLTASYLWRRSDANRLSSIRYEDYLFSTDNLLGYTLRQQDELEAEPNSEYSLIYRRKFSEEGHEFTAEAKYLNYWEHSDQSFPQQTFFPDGTEDVSKALYEKSLNDEYENQYLFQLDYVRPLGKDGKFETGLRSSFRDMVNDYQVTSRNASGVFEVIPGLDNYFIYNENINGAYLIYGNKRNKLSWQGGIRAEHTDIETILRET
ncbi:MAG: outer membrane beta-barrel protein, partial [Bacteroidota bacterium]